ncbi:LysR family transcriptional regulator [Kistimonas asteriae]|uniref:LysR family transcriptional regulator n=1 Tax=Kistimonas asteriae TaxID=517724 RepID=UPI001BA5020A
MDKLEAIRSFVEVAQSGSFTQAAEQLSLNRAKVTRHVQELEDWFNLRLLNRTTRSVSLTPPGHDVLLSCKRILNDVAGLENLAQYHHEELVGEIRIASPVGLAQGLLYDVLDTFSKKHPNIVFQLLLSDKNAQLVDERVDIALRYTDKPDENLIGRHLMHIESAICCSADYLKQHGTISQPDDLQDRNCLIHIDQDQWCFIQDKQPLLVPVNGSIRSNELGIIVRAAINHLGVAYLPCDMANRYLEDGRLVQVLKEVRLPVMSLWALYLSRSYQRPAIRAFIDFLADCLNDDIRAAG